MWRSLTGYQPVLRPIAGAGTEHTLTAVGDRLLAVNHDTLAASVLDGHSFRPFTQAPLDYDARFETGAVHFTASADRLYLLDAWGGLWHARERETFSPLASPEDGPGGRRAGETVLVWDAAERRLVLFGDFERNDTWVFDGRWRKLDCEIAPPAGPARAVSTPNGIHLFCRGELWCLLKDTWLRLHMDRELHATALLHDPRRGMLLAVGATVAVFDRDSFRHVAAVPPTVGNIDAVGLDPLGDRLVRITEHGIETLALSSLVLEQPRRRDSDTWMNPRQYDA